MVQFLEHVLYLEAHAAQLPHDVDEGQHSHPVQVALATAATTTALQTATAAVVATAASNAAVAINADLYRLHYAFHKGHGGVVSVTSKTVRASLERGGGMAHHTTRTF